MMSTISLVKEHCFGCSACKQICPVSCISLEPDSKGFLYPIVDELQCIGCGLCLQVCPYITDQSLGAELYPNTLVYAAKHEDRTIRMQSSSGGAFTAISDYVLEQKGVIYGVAYDNTMTARHIRVDSPQQRDSLRGSKYVQSDLGDTFKEVEKDLNLDRTVLFTGTPCQVAGLRNYLQNEYEKLLLVDLVCYGVPSPKIFTEYMFEAEKKEGRKVIDCTFREKSKGWRNMVLQLDFGSKITTLDSFDSPYYTLFLKRTILRPSCHECKFCNFNRSGDITIGDFWGIEESLPEFEDEKGVSLLLVNSKKGKTLFKKIAKRLDYIESTHEKCLQPPFLEPTPPNKDKDAFWQEYETYGYSYVANKYGRS